MMEFLYTQYWVSNIQYSYTVIYIIYSTVQLIYSTLEKKPEENKKQTQVWAFGTCLKYTWIKLKRKWGKREKKRSSKFGVWHIASIFEKTNKRNKTKYKNYNNKKHQSLDSSFAL